MLTDSKKKLKLVDCDENFENDSTRSVIDSQINNETFNLPVVASSQMKQNNTALGK